MIGCSQKYPKDGPEMDQAEQIKYQRFLIEFHTLKRDLMMTNEILGKIAIGDLN